MVVVEAARRGKQLGEVHGFAAAAVEFVDLGAAAESVGEDYGVYPGVCSVSSWARVSVWSRSRSTRQSSWQQVVEHSESTRLQYALAERGRGAGLGAVAGGGD
jgi:hypothetical protein